MGSVVDAMEKRGAAGGGSGDWCLSLTFSGKLSLALLPLKRKEA